MEVFSNSGEGGFSGTWIAITAAKSFDASLLNVPDDATHWIKYKTGSVAELEVNEVITGGTSAATALIVAKVIDSGTAAATTEVGTLLLRILSGTPTTAGETWTGAGTGTVVTVQAPIEIKFRGQPKSALISFETAAVNIMWNGITAATTALDNNGHNVAAGGSYLIIGQNSVRNFSCINAVNANNAVVKWTLQF